MNIYVILVGALLIVLLVMFGHHSPMDAARKAKANRGGDPLINAIDDYNKKKHLPTYGALPTNNAQPYRPPAQNGYPSYMMNNNQNQTPGAPQNPYPPAPTNSYYPPPPPGTPPSPLQQPRQAQPSLPPSDQ